MFFGYGISFAVHTRVSFFPLYLLSFFVPLFLIPSSFLSPVFSCFPFLFSLPYFHFLLSEPWLRDLILICVFIHCVDLKCLPLTSLSPWTLANPPETLILSGLLLQERCSSLNDASFLLQLSSVSFELLFKR